MTSTERLLAVLSGRIPDRVPISTYELNGWNRDAWENKQPSYSGLMEFIRSNTDCLYFCGVNVPNVLAGRRNVTTDRWDEGGQHMVRTVIHTSTRDLTNVVSHSDDVMTTWTREHTLKDLDDLQAYLDLPWELGEPDYSGLEKAWRDLDGRHGLPLLDMGDPLCEIAAGFDFETFVILAITETEALVKAMDRLHERYLEVLRRALRGPVKNCVFRIYGPEYATPPFLPPELFRMFVTRYDGQYIEMMRQAGVHGRIHSHGRVGRVLDQLARMRIAALDPLEPPPDGDVEIADAKKALPNCCLMGGVELKHLEAADGRFVEDLVRRTIEQGKPGGRFVIMPTAAPINIPLAAKTHENYVRFIQTALECGQY